MPAVRYLVHDVDAVLPFYDALGFALADRWGPPFAIVERQGLELWLAGPGTSAAKPMPDGATPAPGGWNRIVVEVEDLDATRHGLAHDAPSIPAGAGAPTTCWRRSPASIWRSRRSVKRQRPSTFSKRSRWRLTAIGRSSNPGRACSTVT